MGGNIYVRTDGYSKSEFMQLLSENGYIEVATKSTTAAEYRNVFIISTVRKRYTRVVASPDTDILSVEDFIDLFL
jgi:hypothetical protein